MKYLLLVCCYLGIFTLQAQQTTPLTAQEFERTRQEIAGEPFDSKRFDKARALSDAQYLYTAQIRSIMETIMLESNRLEYAKYAYATVLDPENYQQLTPSLRLRTNREILTNFINNRPKPTVPEVRAPEPQQPSSPRNITSNSSVPPPPPPVPTGPQPMDDQAFVKAKLEAGNEDFERKRLQRAKQIVDANYLTTEQISQLMGLLSFESSRKEFSTYAYPKAYDQANYGNLISHFNYTSSKDDFKRFVAAQPVTSYEVPAVPPTPTQPNPTPNAVPNPVNPNATAPTAPAAPLNPTTRGSLPIMDETAYEEIKAMVAGAGSDAQKLVQAKSSIEHYRLSTQQLSGLVELFLFEENRLDLSKYAYVNVADQENFESIKNVLEPESHKDLDDYVRFVNRPLPQTTPPTTGPSELSQEDFDALVKRIQNASLESQKLDRAKTIVDRASVSAMQVQQINQLFSLEESKLEFAQYAYPKTLNKDDYNLVRETLNKPASRYTLDRFIKRQ